MTEKIAEITQITETTKATFIDLPSIVLDDYVENINLESLEHPSCITCYTIIVGSYMHEYNANAQEHGNVRNHEYPKFVNNMFTNPLKQFSPEMIEFIKDNENILIRNIVVLIDSAYSRTDYKVLYGFKDINTDVVNNYKLVYNESKNVNFSMSLNIIVVGENVDETYICKLSDTILKYKANMPVLVNIMDCSSITLNNLYIKHKFHNIKSSNRDNSLYVYIGRPNCLCMDSEVQYMPIITFDSNNGIRWVNYDYDKARINELGCVRDVCAYSENMYQFLIMLYKVQVVEIYFVSIYKMLGFLTITRPMRFGSENIQISETTYAKFIDLCALVGFRIILSGNFDIYFKPNIIKFLEIISYIDKSTLSNKFSIRISLLKFAAEHINNLHVYYPDMFKTIDMNIFENGELDNTQIRTIRDNIIEYINANNVHL